VVLVIDTATPPARSRVVASSAMSKKLRIDDCLVEKQAKSYAQIGKSQ
jgi:hypothetical protein